MQAKQLKAVETHIRAVEQALHDLSKKSGRNLRLGLRPNDGTLLVLDAEASSALWEIPNDCGIWWLSAAEPPAT